MGRLAGKVALVTGASRGIGAATARALAEEGAAVGLLARSRDAIAALAEEIVAAGGRAAALPCDVADPAAVADAVTEAGRRLSRIDILVSNAAVIEPIAPLAEVAPEDWMRAVSINLMGVFNGMRAVLPGMIAAGGGTLISVGSGAAQTPLEGWSAYCSTKAAVLMLARCTHHELKGRGIRVFSLSPGTIATDMQRTIRASGINPVSRMAFEEHAPPEHPARAVVWLCTPAADRFAGQELHLRDTELRRQAGLP
jgi:NAD(P)-dependent dehydrogenase (short-subunit alcohol dehydrogenase family)